MRTLIFTTAVAPTGISIYRELNQAHYDEAITDKHIRSLAHNTGLISREALVETGGPSAVTKATKVVMTSPIKKKNMDKLKRIMIVDDEQDVMFAREILQTFKVPFHRRDDPACSNHGFGDDSGDVVGTNFFN